MEEVKIKLDYKVIMYINICLAIINVRETLPPILHVYQTEAIPRWEHGQA